MQPKRKNGARVAIVVVLIIMLVVPQLMFSYLKRSNLMKSALTYTSETYPLERNGIDLYLDRLAVEGSEPERNILLVHGVTYSSGEFDLNYKDYSLARYLARAGYAVWRLDIAGYGRSEAVEDGFLPDSDYAAGDIGAAVELIVRESGADKLDLLGWSWGTVTASRYVAADASHVDHLVLYAPILSGLGALEVSDPFHVNTWEHAADDFQRGADGDFDTAITDPLLIDVWCSTRWRYDGASSPNGGRRDICVPETEQLIDLKQISVPTLVICGDQDPYLNYALVGPCVNNLPEGSKLEVIEGGGHAVFVEQPYYQDFQARLGAFLGGQ